MNRSSVRAASRARSPSSSSLEWRDAYVIQGYMITRTGILQRKEGSWRPILRSLQRLKSWIAIYRKRTVWHSNVKEQGYCMPAQRRMCSLGEGSARPVEFRIGADSRCPLRRFCTVFNSL